MLNLVEVWQKGEKNYANCHSVAWFYGYFIYWSAYVLFRHDGEKMGNKKESLS